MYMTRELEYQVCGEHHFLFITSHNPDFLSSVCLELYFVFTSLNFLSEKKYSSDEYFFHVVMRQKMLYQPCLKGTCKSVQTMLESTVAQG